MKVLSATLSGFLSYTEPRTFDFAPEVNLITGRNGSGKTSIVEGIIWAFWGDTLRGARVMEGEVSLRLGATESLARRAKGGRQSVSLGGNAWGAGKTRTEGEIEAMYGTAKAWRRTLHLTGRTVSAFSLGTPSERLKHMEYVTDVWRFGAAHDAARKVLQDAKTAENLKRSQYFDEAKRKERHKENLRANWPANVTDGGADTESIRADIDHREARIQRLSFEVEGLQVALELAVSRANEAGAEAARLSRLYQMEPDIACEACGSPTRSPEREILQIDFEAAKLVQSQLMQKVNSERVNLNERSRLLDQLRYGLETAKLLLRQAEFEEDAFLKEDMRCAKYVRDLIESAYLLQRLKREHQIAVERVEAAELAMAALGPKGARLAYLSQFLGTIEAHANHFLNVMGSPLQVTLSLGEGSLELGVKGAGEGKYEWASSGEQRRVDIAVMLAMAEAAAAVGAVPAGAPLVIDEAFDTLDGEGVESLVAMALDISKRRQVFLISHAAPVLPLGTNIQTLVLG